MKKQTILVLCASVVAIATGCKPKFDAPNAEAGTIDATKYVAIGNSITAGFADGALYYDGQTVSYANLLAQQLKLVGGGDFVQPMMPMNSLGVGSSLNSKYTLGYSTDCLGVTSLAPVSGAGDLNALITSVASEGPFNNMGVPGAKVITAIYPGYGNPANGFGNYNPFFTRMLNSSDYATASMLSKAAEQQPTFFSVFLGNNDVLGYALSGGTSDAITPSAGAAGVGFDASVDVVVNTLTAGGAKGVIANIPDVTSIPYFTTVPYNGLVLDASQAAQLSAAYAPLGISFSEGQNGFIIEDAGAPGGMRQIQAGELILLSVPQDSIKCAGWGSTTPIGDEYVLNATEIDAIHNAVVSYNAKLKAVADDNGLAYVDVNNFMLKSKQGIVYNGVTASAAFVSGGAFSLDGIHLTPLGNALLANEFIKSINSKYNAKIPQINATMYGGVKFP